MDIVVSALDGDFEVRVNGGPVVDTLALAMERDEVMRKMNDTRNAQIRFNMLCAIGCDSQREAYEAFCKEFNERNGPPVKLCVACNKVMPCVAGLEPCLLCAPNDSVPEKLRACTLNIACHIRGISSVEQYTVIQYEAGLSGACASTIAEHFAVQKFLKRKGYSTNTHASRNGSMQDILENMIYELKDRYDIPDIYPWAKQYAKENNHRIWMRTTDMAIVECSTFNPPPVLRSIILHRDLVANTPVSEMDIMKFADGSCDAVKGLAIGSFAKFHRRGELISLARLEYERTLKTRADTRRNELLQDISKRKLVGFEHHVDRLSKVKRYKKSDEILDIFDKLITKIQKTDPDNLLDWIKTSI